MEKKRKEKKKANLDLDKTLVVLLVFEEVDDLRTEAKLFLVENLVEPGLEGHVALVDQTWVHVSEDLLGRESVRHNVPTVHLLQL